MKEAFAGTRQLDRPVDIGDVIWCKGHNVGRASKLGFVIMPYYWQGGKVEAARRLRFVLKRAFDACQKQNVTSIALPHLAGGLYGYEPDSSGVIMFEEMVETILQLDEVSPTYSMNQVAVIDKEMGVIEELKTCIEEVAQRWLPEVLISFAK